MNSVWTHICVGAASGILSTLVLRAAEQMLPLGSRLILPSDAVIAMAGDCPPGWHRYAAASGRYLLGADGRSLESGSVGQSSSSRFEYRDGDLGKRGEVIVSAPRQSSPYGPRQYSPPLMSPETSTGFIALTFCQRR